ncbi:MAG: hypothetical protein JKY02_02715 [Flavobacteriaceae bacterium]|nr:hypothetical protein [Flavobacteriaceae bacterium]
MIQSQNIEKDLNEDGTWEEGKWKTSGTYKILSVYNPEYQHTFTLNEAPDDRNYFKP